MRVGTTDNVLIVTGNVFSYLTLVGEDHWSEVDQEIGLFDRHGEFVLESDHFTSRMSTYPTGEEIRLVQIKLPVGNRSFDPARSDHGILEADVVEQYGRLRRAIGDSRMTKRGMPTPFPSATASSKSVGYINAPLEVRNLKFCLTKTGYLGLVPLSAEVGDVVCTVHASSVRFLLRLCKDIEGAFRLVGKCCVHGIMEGEAMYMKDLVRREISLV